MSSRRRQNSERLFWAKVDQGAEDECWEWQGSKDKNGYGVFGKGVLYPRRAHRFSWTVSNGEVPTDLCVLHHCDNPPCVNPAHLYLGDHADNAQDRRVRDRGVRGERVNTNKLTAEQAREVRDLADAGWVQQDIADAYGIAQTGVSAIKARRTWSLA